MDFLSRQYEYLRHGYLTSLIIVEQVIQIWWQLILLTKLDPQLTHAIRIPGTETTQTVSPFASTLSPNTIMASASARSMLLAKNDNDVVIVAAVRSALTKVWMKSLSHRPERRSLTQISGQERWF